MLTNISKTTEFEVRNHQNSQSGLVWCERTRFTSHFLMWSARKIPTKQLFLKDAIYAQLMFSTSFAPQLQQAEFNGFSLFSIIHCFYISLLKKDFFSLFPRYMVLSSVSLRPFKIHSSFYNLSLKYSTLYMTWIDISWSINNLQKSFLHKVTYYSSCTYYASFISLLTSAYRASMHWIPV